MFRTLSMTNGSLESWKPFARWGFSPKARQMRLMADWLHPVLGASIRLDQCVALCGVFSSVSRTTRSTFSSPISRGPPGRGSSPGPASPSVMKRLRHKPTVKPVVRNFAATAALLAPSAHSKMMRAQNAPTRHCATAAQYAPAPPFARGSISMNASLRQRRDSVTQHKNLLMQYASDFLSTGKINSPRIRNPDCRP